VDVFSMERGLSIILRMEEKILKALKY